MNAARPLPEHVDPDAAQALADLRPVAAALRAAQIDARRAATGSLKESAAARSRVNDLLGQIRLRASRIHVDAEGLLWLLRQEHLLRQATASKRRPAKAVLGRALLRARVEAEDGVEAAKRDLARAQDALERHQRVAAAARAAVQIFGTLP